MSDDHNDKNKEASATATADMDATAKDAPKDAPKDAAKDAAADANPSESTDENRRVNNIKSRYDNEPESNDKDEIRRQVEFYFSDSNLPTDQYLLNQTGGPRNKPVELKIIHNFSRMKRYQPYSAVRQAVAESKHLNIDESDNITRKVPLDDKYTTDVDNNRKLLDSDTVLRSIYAKGFGEEKETTQKDVEEFFEPYGPVRSVRLRRTQHDKTFKGSVFVEFESEELKEQFMNLEIKPQWDDKDLDIKSKSDYIQSKNEDIRNGTIKPAEQRTWNNKHGREHRGGNRDHHRGGDRDRDHRGGRGGRGRGSRGRGGRGGDRDRDGRDRDGSYKRKRDYIDDDDWNARRDRDQRNLDYDDPRDNRKRGRYTRPSPDYSQPYSKDGIVPDVKPSKKEDTKPAKKEDDTPMADAKSEVKTESKEVKHEPTKNGTSDSKPNGDTAQATAGATSSDA